MGDEFNPNALDSLSAYEKSVHSSITTEWTRFKMDYPDASKERIIKFKDYIQTKYQKSEIK